MVPSGFMNKTAKLAIGAGVLINPSLLLDEISLTGVKDRIVVDRNAGIIEPHHMERDKKNKHLSEKIGTTGSGCGPANEDRAKRILKLAKDVPELKEYLGDVSALVNETLDRDEKVLIETTQGTFLSLYHGSYPYVTSKDVTASSACADVGVGPTRVDEVIIVFKSYVTRVGAGPLDNELSEEEIIKRGWVERGTVTGRLRRAAPFNFELAKKAIWLNGATQIALTKLDTVFPEVSGVKSWDELSSNARKFVEKIENKLNLPVTLISTGPASDELIDLRNEKILEK